MRRSEGRALGKNLMTEKFSDALGQVPGESQMRDLCLRGETSF